MGLPGLLRPSYTQNTGLWKCIYHGQSLTLATGTLVAQITPTSKGLFRLHVGQSPCGRWLPHELMQARLAVALSLYFVQGIFPALRLFSGICMQSQRLLHNHLRKVWFIRWHLKGAIPVSVPWKTPGCTSKILWLQCFWRWNPVLAGIPSRHPYTYLLSVLLTNTFNLLI